MVEIRYGEYSEQADLGGKSVAEARGQYKSEFDIPDKARAKLNEKEVKPKLEPETKLNDGDQLCFEEKSRRGMMLLGAFLLTLAVTGGLFTYAYLTTTATIGVTAVSADFAAVTANTSPIQDTVFGTYRGKIGSATLFNVTPAATYPGDLEVNVYLANIDELTKFYSSWMVRLELQNAAGTRVDTDNTTRVLSLHNPTVSFAYKRTTAACYVKCLGGSFRTFPYALWVGLSPEDYDPLIFCRVTQAGP